MPLTDLAPSLDLYVVRHARALAPGLCYGRFDVPVSPDAETAARLVAEQLPSGIEHLYASPSERTRSLASALAALTQLPWSLDARLLELDFGAWEGQRWDAIYEREPAELTAWAESPLLRAPTQGETGLELLERLQAFTDQLRSARVLLVCHAGPIRALRALAALPRAQRSPGAVTGLDFSRPVEPLAVEQLPWE